MTNGLVVMTPSSVAKTGASSTATINADGSVTFGLCETLSLNGVFTGDYDNYMVIIRYKNDDQGVEFVARLRASGTDSTTGYTYQLLNANGSTVSASRTSTTYGRLASQSVNPCGLSLYMFGPYLSQPTAYRTVTEDLGSTATRIHDFAGTHSISSSYDGLTLKSDSTSIVYTGLVTVFGFNQ